MNPNCSQRRSSDLQILIHHIYEYKKGVRSMVLHTMSSFEKQEAEQILTKKNISYIIQSVNSEKINIFFGNNDCVNIIKSFEKKSLTDYTPEQDFILGIMLGYDRKQQCSRYIHTKEKARTQNLLSIA